MISSQCRIGCDRARCHQRVKYTITWDDAWWWACDGMNIGPLPYQLWAEAWPGSLTCRELLAVSGVSARCTRALLSAGGPCEAPPP
jgi:hypothetical protein